MYNADTLVNEQRSAAAFSRQAPVFDALYSGNLIIQYKRDRVRAHLQQYLLPGSHILELNSGTGEDALYLAMQGHSVHATDLSTGMLEVLQKKIKDSEGGNRISVEQCSFNHLQNLQQKGPYDVLFSNFAGLNCTGKLNEVLHSFPVLLKPGGVVTLVIMPSFCLWETLLFFRGFGIKAFRRFFSRKGRTANVEGTSFKCWYYTPSHVIRHLRKDFDLLSVEGLCSLVPPSYLEKFPEKYPRLFSFLKSKENKWKNKWPWKYMGDYFIISFRKKLS